MRSNTVKRLLAMLLVLCMVIPMLPASWFTQASAANNVTLYFNNSSAVGWGDVYCYVWDANGNLPLGAWPGTKMERAEHYLHKIVVSANSGIGFIFSDNLSGQTSDLILDASQIKSGYSFYVDGYSTEVKACRFPTENNGKVTFTYENATI